MPVTYDWVRKELTQTRGTRKGWAGRPVCTFGLSLQGLCLASDASFIHQAKRAKEKDLS